MVDGRVRRWAPCRHDPRTVGVEPYSPIGRYMRALCRKQIVSVFVLEDASVRTVGYP